MEHSVLAGSSASRYCTPAQWRGRQHHIYNCQASRTNTDNVSAAPTVDRFAQAVWRRALQGAVQRLFAMLLAFCTRSLPWRFGMTLHVAMSLTVPSRPRNHMKSAFAAKAWTSYGYFTRCQLSRQNRAKVSAMASSSCSAIMLPCSRQ